MQLILFRHGIAEDVGPDGTDYTRRLTDEGVEKTRRAALGMAAIADAPDVILTSPLTRARQTAEIAAEVFGVDTDDVQIADVIGQQNVDGIIEAASRRSEERVMIVGHEPSFSGVVERLVAGRTGLSTVQMKKAGAACLVVNGSHAELQWLATPRMLRKLADG